MYRAVCADCGNKCEVPFKPDPNRPVYCRECWAERRERRERGNRGALEESGTGREGKRSPSKGWAQRKQR